MYFVTYLDFRAILQAVNTAQLVECHGDSSGAKYQDHFNSANPYNGYSKMTDILVVFLAQSLSFF
jgi:hypothetical protein